MSASSRVKTSVAAKWRDGRFCRGVYGTRGTTGSGDVGMSSWLSMYSSLVGNLKVSGAVCLCEKRSSGESAEGGVVWFIGRLFRSIGPSERSRLAHERAFAPYAMLCHSSYR